MPTEIKFALEIHIEENAVEIKYFKTIGREDLECYWPKEMTIFWDIRNASYTDVSVAHCQDIVSHWTP